MGMVSFGDMRKAVYDPDRDGLLDAEVHLTTDQTIAGVKTFTSIPVGPAEDPTTDNQLARKAYVDDQAGAAADTVHFITPSTILSLTDTADVDWTDLTMPAEVPSGSTGVIVQLACRSILTEHGTTFYVRKKGQANSPYLRQDAYFYHTWLRNMGLCAIDADKKIQYKILGQTETDHCDVEIGLFGYIK